MAQNTTADGASEDQKDIAVETEVEIGRMKKVVNCSVVGRSWPGIDHDVIIVSWNQDDSSPGVNSYHKAGVINSIYQSNASVELYDACDAEPCVTFKVSGE